jgi:hypothetical protein
MAYQERCSGPPHFDGKNYKMWSKRMGAFLRGKGQLLWDVTVDTGYVQPMDFHSLPPSLVRRIGPSPIKQKLWRFAEDRKQVIEVEVGKLLAVGFIRECKHPVWLANPVLVPKKTGRLRICIDYTDLNKHYPKDPFPFPHIDKVVDSTGGSVLLCFLDCYLGYHQIALHLDDEDKTTFIMPHGFYCYKVMTFGLKNARDTYQKAIQKCLKS